MTYTPKQGDIVFLNFNSQSGHEQSGKRPGLIVSNDQFFLRTKLALVCPITNTVLKRYQKISLKKQYCVYKPFLNNI